MHKNDFFPFIFFSYHSFSLSYLELQIIFPCRDIGPATATLDPRPRHWTCYRDFGPATRDPRLLVKLINIYHINRAVYALVTKSQHLLATFLHTGEALRMGEGF